MKNGIRLTTASLLVCEIEPLSAHWHPAATISLIARMLSPAQRSPSTPSQERTILLLYGGRPRDRHTAASSVAVAGSEAGLPRVADNDSDVGESVGLGWGGAGELAEVL